MVNRRLSEQHGKDRGAQHGINWAVGAFGVLNGSTYSGEEDDLPAVGAVDVVMAGLEFIGASRVRSGEVLVAELIPDKLVAAAHYRKRRRLLHKAQFQYVVDRLGGSLAEVS